MKRTELLNARKKIDLTQQEVADKIGISKQQYCRIENAQQIGSVEIWDKLEDLFQIPQRQLREIEKQPDSNQDASEITSKK